MSGNKRPSLKDVASAAGVSAGVVSAVVNGSVGTKIRASTETKERILKAVKDLGYTPHPIARRLAGGRNYLIAVFTYEPIFPFEHRNFYYPFLLGIERTAEDFGYDLLLITRRKNNGDDDTKKESALSRLRIADGAILFGLSRNEQELFELANSGYPLVSIGRRDFTYNENTVFIAADYKNATIDIIKRLYRFGHRNYAYLRVMDDTEPTQDREEGFVAGIKLTGSDNSYIKKRCAPETIDIPFVESLLDKKVTAVVVERYAIAEALEIHIQNLGLNIPEDISIVVLGGPKESGQINREWTAFSIPDQEMGSSAVKSLVSLIEKKGQTESLFLDCSFLPGNTIGLRKQ